MNIKNFDFLDFGASKGTSIEFAKEHLFGKKGLGIDLDPERVEIMREAGYDCMVGDITNLRLPARCVKFVKMAHILEHLPDLRNVEKAVATAKKSATNFLVITGPFFDAEDYLASKGLKLYWSDYIEHTCHLKVSQLIKILQKLKLENYELYLRYPITDSSDEHIQPLSSPPGSHHYDPKIHPPKKNMNFDRLIWVDFVCYVQIGETKDWGAITKAYRNQIPYIEQKGDKRYVWPEQTVKKFIEVDEETQAKDKTIQKLKEQNAQYLEKISILKCQLLDIRSSKSWKAVRGLHKTAAIIKRPSGLISRPGK